MNQAVAAARAVLFDFDFTLADSSEGIVVCMNHAGPPGAPSGFGGRHPQDHRARSPHGARDSGGRGVVTTKYRHRVEDALERDGLRALVEVIVGADDVPRPKPAPDGLLQAVDSLGIPAGDCVFVGDSEVGARAARAAGMGLVAVLSGTTTAGVFARYPARAVLGGVGEIVPEM